MSRRSNGYTRIKALKKKGSSSTAGILKGDNCQKSPLKIQFCKDARMYRTNPRKYAVAEAIVRRLNDKKH